MSDSWRLSRAILERELRGYFSSPSGYVFITLFVFLSAIAAFWQEAFFFNNLADLRQLNNFFPYLLIFLIPAITMTTWAEEKRNGTDELLLTLPATDFEIVIGKYLAALSIYTAALFFSVSHVFVLLWLGSPDLGLLFTTYFGYWLMGAALLALGMVASLLTDNLTVAFILGGFFCAVPIFINDASVILSGGLARLVEELSITEQFRDLSNGIIPVSSLLYFLGFAAAMLYLNVALLGRRHWPTGKDVPKLGLHYTTRGLSLVVLVAALTIFAGRIGGRLDFTAEKIHSLSRDTARLLTKLDINKPVFIQAYISPVVPRSYLQTRNNIVNLLREFDLQGGDRIHSRIVMTEKYTAAAREAQERFNISSRDVPLWEQTEGGTNSIFMGIAFTSGADEFVIPFFDPGLPVEYELTRSVRVVARTERKKIGILDTPARLFGGFNFQERRQTADWSIVTELRKQYEVTKVTPGDNYPTDIDALLVTLPNTLQQSEVDNLTEYAKAGNPLLVVVDPLPAFNIDLSPQKKPQNPFNRGAPPPSLPANTTKLLEVLGVEWNHNEVIWDRYNPHPQYRNLPPEVIFIGPGNGSEDAFNSTDSITSGMQELVALYSGRLEPKENTDVSFTPLLSTGKNSNVIPWTRLVQRSLFGVQIATNLPHRPSEESYILAARILGQSGDRPIKSVVIADIDMLGEQFFQLRRQGIGTLSFDNVNFLLNAVDQLIGDESFITLRKRRRRHRTLEAMESRTKTYEDQRLKDIHAAEASAEKKLEEAQTRLDKAVQNLQNRKDLDEQTKRIMIANQQKAENRRLQVAQANIEDEKQRLIDNARADMESSIRAIQNTIKLLAVALSPVPAFALFVLVSIRRLRRENIGASVDRLVTREHTS
tara:strand:+ start:9487 stop:12129 length:2643 start_codon:yes stop_codon:yes gene_type:complete